VFSEFGPVNSSFVHPLFEKASGLTEKMIAAAIEVHRDKGPGLIESIYEWCLLKELGPAFELYEVAEHSCWVAHQFA
jgi:hypothetical protein